MTVIGPRAKAGTLKPLVVTSPQRSPALPDVPTVMEAGISDYAFVHWFGILAPANTPPAIAKRLRDEVAKALASSDVVDELDRQGMRPLATEPEEWRAYLKSELEHYMTQPEVRILPETAIACWRIPNRGSQKICASALAESSGAFANVAKKNAALNESTARRVRTFALRSIGSLVWRFRNSLLHENTSGPRVPAHRA